MKNVRKNLNNSICEKGIGFKRREDLDFRDDGASFKGYEYKGMPITTCRDGKMGLTFLCVRPDYLDRKYTWNDWRKTNEYVISDEFNGVEFIDIEKLAENCEKIIAKVAELNEKAMTETIDMTKVEEQVQKENVFLKSVINDVKENLRWWNIDSDYKLKDAKRYIKSLMRSLEKLENMDFSKMDNAERREYSQHFEEYGYVEIQKDDFYIRELMEMVEETNK